MTREISRNEICLPEFAERNMRAPAGRRTPAGLAQQRQDFPRHQAPTSVAYQ